MIITLALIWIITGIIHFIYWQIRDKEYNNKEGKIFTPFPRKKFAMLVGFSIMFGPLEVLVYLCGLVPWNKIKIYFNEAKQYLKGIKKFNKKWENDREKK